MSVSQKHFKNSDTSANSSAAAPSVAAASPLNTASSPVVGLTDVQQQMVQQFTVQSGMNATWSARYSLHACSISVVVTQADDRPGSKTFICVCDSVCLSKTIRRKLHFTSKLWNIGVLTV